MVRFRIRTSWTNSISQTHEFALDDLADASARDRLKWAFSSPERLRPGETRQSLTERAAASFASVAQALRERGHDPQAVAYFVNRLVFCMFADDVGLLPLHLRHLGGPFAVVIVPGCRRDRGSRFRSPGRQTGTALVAIDHFPPRLPQRARPPVFRRAPARAPAVRSSAAATGPSNHGSRPRTARAASGAGTGAQLADLGLPLPERRVRLGPSSGTVRTGRDEAGGAQLAAHAPDAAKLAIPEPAAARSARAGRRRAARAHAPSRICVTQRRQPPARHGRRPLRNSRQGKRCPRRRTASSAAWNVGVSFSLP